MFKNNPDRDVTFAVEINLKSTFCLMEGISGLKNEKPFERSCRQLIKSILTLHDDAFGNTSKDIVRSLFVNISCRKKKNCRIRNQIEGLRGQQTALLICWPRWQVPFFQKKETKHRKTISKSTISNRLENEAVETSRKRHKQISAVKWLFGKPLKRERKWFNWKINRNKQIASSWMM